MKKNFVHFYLCNQYTISIFETGCFFADHDSEHNYHRNKHDI